MLDSKDEKFHGIKKISKDPWDERRRRRRKKKRRKQHYIRNPIKSDDTYFTPLVLDWPTANKSPTCTVQCGKPDWITLDFPSIS